MLSWWVNGTRRQQRQDITDVQQVEDLRVTCFLTQQAEAKNLTADFDKVYSEGLHVTLGKINLCFNLEQTSGNKAQ